VLEAVLDLHVEVGVEQVLVVVHVLDGVLELEELRLCLAVQETATSPSS